VSGRDFRREQHDGGSQAGEAPRLDRGKTSVVETFGSPSVAPGQPAEFTGSIPVDWGMPDRADAKQQDRVLGLFGIHGGRTAEPAAATLPDGKPAKNSLDVLEAELGAGTTLGGHEAGLARRAGADPSTVRVHRGPDAGQAAAQQQATAFTVGNHVVMGSRAPAEGTALGDELLQHEAAHVAQQQDAAKDPAQRAKPIGGEDQAAERDVNRTAHPGLAPTGSPGRTGLQLQRWPWDLPQQTPKDIGTGSVAGKAAFIKKSVAEADEGWSRVVVDVFEQTDPAARIALQHQLDMEQIVKAMPAFEATRLGTFGPLTAGQAMLNKKRAAYIEQVINDFGDRAEVFVLFAFRGVYDDDAYTIFAELANRRYLHKLLAMPDVAKQIKARGLKTDGFDEPGTGVLGGVGGVLGGMSAGLKHMVKDDRPGMYGWQKDQLPPKYADALSQMEMAQFESNLTVKNAVIGAIDEVTFGVPHGVVDLGRNTVSAIGDIAHGEYRAAGERLSSAAVVLLTHLGVKAWRVINSVKARAPAPGTGVKPVDSASGIKGPEGPGQFVIPGFEGPISAEEAKLGAIFELNPEAQAAMGRLIARIGRGGIEKLAEMVQASSRVALFVAEHGEPGVYALLEADGDAALAGTKLPKRQLAAGTAPETATPVNRAGARVDRPGNHPELIKELNSKAKIDPKYTRDPRFDSLAADPDHAGKGGANSLQEAMAGLEAEARGLLKGPIERGPKGIEFYDVEGRPWDVKKPPSPPPGAKWSFDLERAVKAIQKQVRLKFPNNITGAPEPVRVLLDSSYMTPADHAVLWADLHSQLSAEELSLIVELNAVP
jgi:Domain of unknown function (DUF4157)